MHRSHANRKLINIFTLEQEHKYKLSNCSRIKYKNDFTAITKILMQKANWVKSHIAKICRKSRSILRAGAPRTARKALLKQGWRISACPKKCKPKRYKFQYGDAKWVFASKSKFNPAVTWKYFITLQ